MSRLVKRTLSIAAAGLIVSWLLLAGNSPVAPWLTTHPVVTNLASAVNLPGMLFAMAGFPSTRAPTALAIASVLLLQWLAYGFALAWLWGKLWPNSSSKPTPLRGAA